jgi:site-specific recombinase XerD
MQKGSSRMDTEPTRPAPMSTATEYVSPPRLLDLMPQWVGWLQGKGHRPNGVTTYRKEMRALITALGDDATVADLTYATLERHQAAMGERGSAPKTTLKRLSAYRSFCRWCVKRAYLQADPTADLDFPKKPQSLPKALGGAQLRALWAYVTNPPETLTSTMRWRWSRNLRLVALALFAGLRRSELVALCWKHCDLEQGILHILDSKNGKDRNVPIHPKLLQILLLQPEADRAPEMAVIGHHDGTPITGQAIGHIFERWAAQGVPGLHVHALRHTFATEILRNGGDIRAIQDLLGHASLDTTSIYLRVDVTQSRRAVDLLPSSW